MPLVPPSSIGGTPYGGSGAPEDDVDEPDEPDEDDEPEVPDVLPEEPLLELSGSGPPGPPVQAATIAAADAAKTTFARVIFTPLGSAAPVGSVSPSLSTAAQKGQTDSVLRT